MGVPGRVVRRLRAGGGLVAQFPAPLVDCTRAVFRTFPTRAPQGGLPRAVFRTFPTRTPG